MPPYGPSVRVLRAPGFAWLLLGQAMSAIGNWVAVIAIWGFASFRFDASAADLALLFVVLAVPGAVLGPLVGVAIDRLGPRRSLAVANVLGALDALALSQVDSYLAIVALALPLGLIEATASASLDALPPRIVADEDLVRANALLGSAQDLALVVGPVVAAAVNSVWGLAGAFAADAASFAVALATVAALPRDLGAAAPGEPRSPAPPPDPGDPRASEMALGAPVAPVELGSPRAWAETRQGLALARSSPQLRWLLGLSLLTVLVWGTFGVVEPLYVRDVLGASDNTFAYLQAVFGGGLLGAGAILTAAGDRAARPRLVAAATVASGAGAVLYVGTGQLAVAYAGVFLWGLATALVLVPVKTLLQRWTPRAAHGRILALHESVEPSGNLVSTPLAALVVGGIGVQPAGVVGGLVLVAGGLLAARMTARFAGTGPSAGGPLRP